MKVKFLINPTGKFNLAYNAGEIVDLDSKQCELLLEADAIEIIEEDKIEKPKVTKKKPINPEIELDAE